MPLTWRDYAISGRSLVTWYYRGGWKRLQGCSAFVLHHTEGFDPVKLVGSNPRNEMPKIHLPVAELQTRP